MVLVQVLMRIEGLVGVVRMTNVSGDSDRRHVHAGSRLVSVALGEVILEQGLGATSKYVPISDGVAWIGRRCLGSHLMHGRQTWDANTRHANTRHANTRHANTRHSRTRHANTRYCCTRNA